jgi:hypothetical protein
VTSILAIFFSILQAFKDDVAFSTLRLNALVLMQDPIPGFDPAK